MYIYIMAYSYFIARKPITEPLDYTGESYLVAKVREWKTHVRSGRATAAP
jgi:hypothetical protein